MSYCEGRREAEDPIHVPWRDRWHALWQGQNLRKGKWYYIVLTRFNTLLIILHNIISRLLTFTGKGFLLMSRTSANFGCQRTNWVLQKPRAELHPIPVTKVWHRVGIDLVGPLSETRRWRKWWMPSLSSSLCLSDIEAGVFKVLPFFLMFNCQPWKAITLAIRKEQNGECLEMASDDSE